MNNSFISDDYSTVDLIGHDAVVQSLSSLVKTAQIERRGSFTIGVFGEWGTGKYIHITHGRSKSSR